MAYYGLQTVVFYLKHYQKMSLFWSTQGFFLCRTSPNSFLFPTKIIKNWNFQPKPWKFFNFLKLTLYSLRKFLNFLKLKLNSLLQSINDCSLSKRNQNVIILVYLGFLFIQIITKPFFVLIFNENNKKIGIFDKNHGLTPLEIEKFAFF